MAEQIQPNCSYPVDAEFPTMCLNPDDYSKAYCCLSNFGPDDFVGCEDSSCQIGPYGCQMTFPAFNDEQQPMYKTALSGTAMSPWVRIAFQQYTNSTENPFLTWKTILTMGNQSQPYNDEECMAMIQSFQYGWGTTNQGNRCRIRILDQKGSSFQEWVERMGINPEGDTVPVQGKYNMKVQWGWYTSGGADEDICGQPTVPLEDENNNVIQNVPEGYNTAFGICSPVMYFLTEMINVHFENGKFIYELEAVDTCMGTGQQNIIQRTFSNNGQPIYFTKAVELLGMMSFPPFRVEFKAKNAMGQVEDMQFVPGDGENTNDFRQCNSGSDCENYNFDCQGWGPKRIWPANTMPPLAVIHEWAKTIFVKDLTGKIPSGKTSFTMNYDSTYKFDPNAKNVDPCLTCTSAQPQYGRLILWANPKPYCQGNFTDSELNTKMKAVYVVNGGNCSPVLQFNPSFSYNSLFAAQKAAGSMNVAVTNTARGGFLNDLVVAVNQIIGAVKTGCQIAASPGPLRQIVSIASRLVMKLLNPNLHVQEATYHHVMTNLGIGAIEAELRVQGDPSNWLCSPFEGTGVFVGIVFINPYFLVDGQNENDCPVWAGDDPNNPDPQFKSICNKLLTNKGWFVDGVDHQIKDGQYITTIKLKLPAPGAELNPAGSITNLGAWGYPTATPMVYGGQSGCLERILVGSAAAAWTSQLDGSGNVIWVGGGTPCQQSYDNVPSPPPIDDD